MPRYQPYYPKGFVRQQPRDIDLGYDAIVEAHNRKFSRTPRVFRYTQKQLEWIDRAEALSKLTKQELIIQLIDCQDSLEALS